MPLFNEHALFNEHGNYNHLPPEHPVQILEDEIYRLVRNTLHNLRASPLEMHALAHHIMGTVSHAFSEQIVRNGFDARRANQETLYAGIDWLVETNLAMQAPSGLPADGCRRIPLIKTLRDRLQCSLRDAKDLCDMAQDRGVFDPPHMRMFATGPTPSRGTSGVRDDPANPEGSVPWNQ